MNELYYKYIDPIVDYLQPLPKIVSDPVVISTVLLFVAVTVVWGYLFWKACKE